METSNNICIENKPRIITRSGSRWQTEDWQNALKSQISSVSELFDYCGIDYQAEGELAELAHQGFTVKVSRHYASLIEHGNAQDPLLLQVLPGAQEVQQSVDVSFSKDPLQEQQFNLAPGLVHKYHGRVLLIANPSCAIHCRYCFRRHFDYQANTPSRSDWQQALGYIQQTSSIHEVILSGGDPLMNNDKQLQFLIQEIAAINHVQTLRIHSRIPSVMPERITHNLLQALTNSRLKVVMVLHMNHANEISDAVVEACQLLQQHGIRLYNQSVLLKGVNDNAAALEALFMRLHQHDIQAYYLHLLDKVDGAEHFLVSDKAAISLYHILQAKLPAYMLPKLAREEAQHSNKTLIAV